MEAAPVILQQGIGANAEPVERRIERSGGKDGGILFAAPAVARTRSSLVEVDASEKLGGRGYLRLRGELVGDVTLAEFRRHLEHHFVDDGVTEIRVDLSDVSEISLEGVAILLRLLDESTRRGKRFLVEGADGQVLDKLRVTGTLRPLGGDA